MVEPLRRIAVAHRAAELDAPIRVEQLRSHHADVLVAPRGVLQARQPAAQRLHVGVEDHDVAPRVGRAQAAVDIGRKALVALRRQQHVDAADPPQRREVLGAAAVV